MSKIEKSVITLGIFDGVHLGHRKIIDALLNEARRINAIPIIVTFFPHPTHVLTPDNPLKMINSLEERIMLLKKKGVRTIIVNEFTKEFASRPALDFIKETLLEDLNMQVLIVGYDHSFGKNKEGDYLALSKYANQLGFSIKRIAAFVLDDKTVSSTLLRKYLKEGAIDKVNQLLDYSFCLFGKVVKGNQLGRTIGFRTANIELDYPNKIVPKIGVYIVKSRIDSQTYFGMMNIGYRPTVQGKNRTIEVHFFGIQKDLYEKSIKVKLLYYLREEYKFENVSALKEQLLLDKKKSLDYIKSL